jgi:hypothetical protein
MRTELAAVLALISSGVSNHTDCPALSFGIAGWAISSRACAATGAAGTSAHAARNNAPRTPDLIVKAFLKPRKLRAPPLLNSN